MASYRCIETMQREPRIFTPLNEARTERLSFPLSSVIVLYGNLDRRGYWKHAVVKISGRKYEVYGIGCGLEQCVCDVYIKEVRV